MNRNNQNGKSDKDWEYERLRMVEDQLKKRGISDGRVLRAMEKVPRHLFVPQESINLAYTDGPLPIGEGQTVSQPYMVALMTECLALRGTEKVLEIGTGSGYQSAVLMELVRELYTVERIHHLAEKAEQQQIPRCESPYGRASTDQDGRVLPPIRSGAAGGQQPQQRRQRDERQVEAIRAHVEICAESRYPRPPHYPLHARDRRVQAPA